MANAKRCDICGRYFPLADASMLHKTLAGKVMLYKTAENIHHTVDHPCLYFDACDDCVQEITDLILEKRATWEIKEEE